MLDEESISIVAASPEDYAWCAQLMASSEPWLTLRRDRADDEAALKRPASDLFIVFQKQQRIGLLLLQSSGLAGSPYIAAIAVVPQERGLGVGTKMLDFAEQCYPQAGNIFLCVSDFNAGARELYARRGYAVVGELSDYVVVGHSELIMRKKLR